MKTITVTNLNYPELDVYARLTEAQLRNRLEPEKGIFIAESLKVVRIALECGLEPISFLAEKKYIDEQIKPLLDTLNSKFNLQNSKIFLPLPAPTSCRAFRSWRRAKSKCHREA